MIVWASLGFVINSWAIFEGSPEGENGIPGVFALKTMILVFCLLVGLQGLALMARSLMTLKGETPPQSRKPDLQGEGV